MPFMEFLRGTITMSAATTYTELEIRTPVSKTEELAMLIHQVRWDIAKPTATDAATVRVAASLHDRPQTDTAQISDPGCISRHSLFAEAGVTEGTLSEFATFDLREGWVYYFTPPLLYAKDAIYLGVNSDHATLLVLAQVRIGYTLERVSSADFIAALVG